MKKFNLKTAFLIIALVNIQLTFIYPLRADIRITSPADGDSIFGEVKVIAEADDNSKIDEVKFFVNSQRTGYCLNPPFEKIINISLQGTGTHSIRVKAIYKSGLSLWSEPVRIIIDQDKNPPVTISDYRYPQIWINTDARIKLRAHDDLSGVKATYYKIDDKPVQRGNVVIVKEPDSHFVQFWSEDNSGNLETRQFVNVRIDKTPPVTTYSISPEPGSRGWFTELPVTISYSATDNLSGVLSSPAKEIVYMETIKKIKYFSEDVAGNTEKTKKLIVKTDMSEPIVIMSLESTKPYKKMPAHILWPLSRKPVQVNILGQTFDNLSGVASVKFTVTDEYGQVEPPITKFGDKIKLVPWRNNDDQDGRIYTITVVVTDYAGNSNTLEKIVRVPNSIKDIVRELKEEKERKKREEEQRKKEEEQWRKEDEAQQKKEQEKRNKKEQGEAKK